MKFGEALLGVVLPSVRFLSSKGGTLKLLVRYLLSFSNKQEPFKILPDLTPGQGINIFTPKKNQFLQC
jgi:hypothetical protein